MTLCYFCYDLQHIFYRDAVVTNNTGAIDKSYAFCSSEEAGDI